MVIAITLPKDRTKQGTITWRNAAGDSKAARCRGKADNQMAAQKGNPERDPRRPFGDHPSGGYDVTGVEPVGQNAQHSYGPWKIRLMPTSGDALERMRFEGQDPLLEQHGGDVAPDGVTLRPTYGCLRLDNSTVTALAGDIQEIRKSGEQVTAQVSDV